MAFNYFPNYMPYNPQNTPFQPPVPQRHEIVKVNGKNGAEAFQMAQNSSILLLDETAPIVWLKTTDGAGYPTLTPYTISPYQPEPEVNVKSLEERITAIEEIINAKPDRTSTSKSKSASSAS